MKVILDLLVSQLLKQQRYTTVELLSLIMYEYVFMFTRLFLVVIIKFIIIDVGEYGKKNWSMIFHKALFGKTSESESI